MVGIPDSSLAAAIAPLMANGMAIAMFMDGSPVAGKWYIYESSLLKKNNPNCRQPLVGDGTTRKSKSNLEGYNYLAWDRICCGYSIVTFRSKNGSIPI